MFSFLIALLVVEFIILVVCAEQESWWGGILSLAAIFFVIDHWFITGSLSNLWSNIYHNPGLTALYIGAYVLLGVIWSFYKWYLHLKKEMIKIKDQKEKNKVHKNSPNYIETTLEEFAKTAYSSKVQASQNKEKITVWMIYWPFSMFWYIISDPITKFYSWLFRRFTRIYDKITDSVIKS